jgi:hypothetical protein
MEDSLIPQEKCEAVTRGLREAFGVTTFEDIRMLNKGLFSALVYRIVVQGSPYLLRVIMRSEDSTRHFTSMMAAAEAGLAPRVRYSSIEDRVAITDWVEAVPFPVTDALALLPRTLRTLHALPPFLGVPHPINTSCMFLLNQGPALDGFLRTLQAANILPTAELEELLALYAQVAAVYPLHDSDMVSSHNDLKPENILFDGRQVWLVDWEAAFLNDRYNDLAVVANFVVTNDAEERAYLHDYFGHPPDPYQRARFFLMQQVAHLFYTLAYLMLGSGWRPVSGKSGSGEPVNLGEPAPDFRDFHRRIRAGEVDLEDNQMKTVYGKVHRERLLQNVRQPRFAEALRIVSGRCGSAKSG